MKKLLTLSLAAVAAFALQADSFFRSDIYAVKDQIELSAKSENMRTGKQTWLKNADDQKYTAVIISKKLADDWQDLSYTIVPSKSGNIDIAIMGDWAKNREDRGWLLVDSVRVNGELLPNGDFKKTYKKNGKQIPNKFWLAEKAQYIPDGGIDGSPAILVNHDNRSSLTLKNAEAGKAYTFQFTVKAADAPAE